MLSSSEASTSGDHLMGVDGADGADGHGDFPDEAEEAPFLWEQISASIDPVELHEVQRVVGTSLINGLTDIYSEIRALREIHRDYSAGTDELVKTVNSLPRSTGSQPAGLVQLELKSLVAQLRKRAAANGVDAEALLPVPSSPQRKALESVLREAEGGGGGGGGGADALPGERARTAYLGARPGTADSERLSLREMRLGGGGSASASRPSTASMGAGPGAVGGSRPVTSSSSSRPPTAATGGGAAMGGGGGGGGGGGSGAVAPAQARSPRGGGSSRPGSRGGRPVSSSGRPGSAASCCSSTGSASVADDEGGGHGGGGGGSSRRGGSSRPSRSGLVVSRLRAALEEERQALLAQSEALRLSIEDEHDYRGRVAQPPPSLTSLLELKRSLQDILAKTPDHLPAACMLGRPATAVAGGGGVEMAMGGAGLQAQAVQVQAQARGRSSLSQHAPLPELPRAPRPGEQGAALGA